MDQQETLALWARCEAARRAAKAAGADDAAVHAAATAVWNGWAQPLLDRRAAMEAAGTWQASPDGLGSLEGGNGETTAWLEATRAVFSTDDRKHTFDMDVNCSGWIFPGTTRFDGATFSGSTEFGGSTFSGIAGFVAATFTGAARFGKVRFAGDAWFQRVTFSRMAGFSGATFSGIAGFELATFSGDATFEQAMFMGATAFVATTFIGVARFGAATFMADARFHSATFMAYAGFRRAVFAGDAGFRLVKIKGLGTFAGARFEHAASFYAVSGGTGFDLANARFREVPDFIQATFAEAPRFDNVHVAPTVALCYPHTILDKTTRWQAARLWLHRIWSYPWRCAVGCWRRLFRGNRDIPARYRALKRLAIQGHDHEREQMFHAGDITASRFTIDWPLHYRFWSAEGWASVFRFWFGLAYGTLSDFGRSVIRPLVAWVILLLACATLYLGAHPAMEGKRQPYLTDDGTLTMVRAYALSTAAAWSGQLPCVADDPRRKTLGLPEPVQAATNAPTEALFLALGAGLVLGEIGAPDASTRTYGCLYGLTAGDATRNAAVPYPSYVAALIVAQKLLSALLIFLFGLAVRNMLKLK